MNSGKEAFCPNCNNLLERVEQKDELLTLFCSECGWLIRNVKKIRTSNNGDIKQNISPNL